MDFGKVLGGVWVAKILDSRIVFDVFSMSFFKCSWKSEKIDQDGPTRRRRRKLDAGLRCTGPSWGKERIGERTLQVELRERRSRLASCDWTEPVGNEFGTPLAHLRWPAD